MQSIQCFTSFFLHSFISGSPTIVYVFSFFFGVESAPDQVMAAFGDINLEMSEFLFSLSMNYKLWRVERRLCHPPLNA